MIISLPGGDLVESEIICKINRDSEENKKNIEQLRKVLKNILGLKIDINYKKD